VRERERERAAVFHLTKEALLIYYNEKGSFGPDRGPGVVSVSLGNGKWGGKVALSSSVAECTRPSSARFEHYMGVVGQEILRPSTAQKLSDVKEVGEQGRGKVSGLLRALYHER
jgi:hypothetical protein